MVDLKIEAEFIGKAALTRINAKDLKHKQVGIQLDGQPLIGPDTTFWPIQIEGEKVGKITFTVYSPRLKQNIALGFVKINCAALGNELQLSLPNGEIVAGIVEKSFFDPQKQKNQYWLKLNRFAASIPRMAVA